MDDIAARETELRRRSDAANGEENSARGAVNAADNAIRDVTQRLNNVQQDDGNQQTGAKRVGASIDADGKSNVWAVEPKMQVLPFV